MISSFYFEKSKQFAIFAVRLIYFAMLETVKEKIGQLIACYETEKMERERLQAELEQYRQQNETYRKQIIELERQIDNLKLTEAFKAGSSDTAAAKKKIDSLIREIDRCISLMEG